MPYKSTKTCPICQKSNLINLSSHLKYSHGKTVSGIHRVAKKKAHYPPKSNESLQADDTSGKLSNTIVTKTPISNAHVTRNATTKDHELAIQTLDNDSDDNDVSRKQKVSRMHFELLSEYTKWPMYRKQRYLQKHASREFIKFLQEICYNAMKKTFEFERESLLKLDCEVSYLKFINGLLATKHLRNLISSRKMIQVIDCLIPAATRWWKSFN